MGTYVQEFFALRTVLKTAAIKKKELHGGCQVNGPKVAKFLDR